MIKMTNCYSMLLAALLWLCLTTKKSGLAICLLYTLRVRCIITTVRNHLRFSRDRFFSSSLQENISGGAFLSRTRNFLACIALRSLL